MERGATWVALEDLLRDRGMGLRVYPTSAPRSTVGGWLAENGVGVGSYEYGWLLANIRSVEAVMAGGRRHVIAGEDLRHFVGSRGSIGFFVLVRLATRPAADDVQVGAVFRRAEDLAGDVVNLYEGGARLWHLAFLNAAMARARGLEGGHVLFGVYNGERAAWVERALRKAVESNGGRGFPREEAEVVWERRYFAAGASGPLRTPGCAFVQAARLAPTLVQLERKLAGVAIQGTAARWGEVALLAFDPIKGSTGLVDLSAVADVKLAQLAGRSWMQGRR